MLCYAVPSSGRRRGGGEGCSEEPELSHDQNIEVRDRKLLAGLNAFSLFGWPLPQTGKFLTW